MATLEDSSTEDIARLLELFPAPVLKKEWDHLKSLKEEMCADIAAEGDLDKIRNFVATNFGRCKQHVYLMQKWTKNMPPTEDSFPDADLLTIDRKKRRLYLAKIKWKVLLGSPFEEHEVEFLWPGELTTTETQHS